MIPQYFMRQGSSYKRDKEALSLWETSKDFFQMLCIMYINDEKNRLHYFLKYEVTTLELPNNVGKNKTMEKSNAFPVC